MASILKVDKLDPQSGTALEIGTSGDTITVPSGATFAVSGTMNASSITAGTVATARLGSGTASSSTVLYGDQTYKAEPGGAFTKLLTVTASDSATLDFNSTYITSTYRRYLFLFSYIVPADDNKYAKIEFSNDNGSSMQGTVDYVQQYQSNTIGSTYTNDTSSAAAQAYMTGGTVGSGAYEGYSGQLWIIRDDSYYCQGSWQIYGANENDAMYWDGGFSVMGGGINFIRFSFNGGNITSGNITLYGVEN